MPNNPQVSVATLGSVDLKRTKEFYVDGFSCVLKQDHGEFVSLNLGEGSSELALYTWDALAADAGVPPEGTGFRSFTLSYVVDSAEQVDALLAQAKSAGGTIIKPARRALWGGYSGYLTDPDGNLWKVVSTSAPSLLPRGRSREEPKSVQVSPQKTVITLGSADLKRTRQFYAEGLGCPVNQSYGKFVSFRLGEGSSELALYTRDALAADAGVPPEGTGFRGFTLSYVVDSPEQVDALLAQAKGAGGAIAVPGKAAQWGGYSGYFTDPDGCFWKVASAR